MTEPQGGSVPHLYKKPVVVVHVVPVAIYMQLTLQKQKPSAGEEDTQLRFARRQSLAPLAPSSLAQPRSSTPHHPPFGRELTTRPFTLTCV